ncbi:ATP-binding protein [Candidatus Magnetomorum sp. HK-1]|nr:ATP-binding protein [Candidatus Magnetomorum sp. HK-1]
MPQKIIYTKEPAFINRKTELKYLRDWIDQKPDQLLFLYGPKSSGKTTLLMEFIDKNLTNKDFDIKHFNLRTMLISNYKDFIQAFFEIDYSLSNKDHIKKRQEYNLKVFKMTKEVLKELENKTIDPFVVMHRELKKISKKEKRPIIIIDELQALEDIYMNGQRQLLKELFNFFVALTKESHLCHVIIATSDAYFMNRIYDDSKLTKTSNLLEIDYLTKDDTIAWLSNLKKESAITAYTLSENQIEMIWKYFGGSMWEISDILGKLIPLAINKKVHDHDVMHIIQNHITINKGKCFHYARVNKRKRALFKKILAIQSQQVDFNESDLESIINVDFYEEDALTDELNNLVRLNYLAYNPITSSYKLQGKCMYYGLKAFVESFHKK